MEKKLTLMEIVGLLCLLACIYFAGLGVYSAAHPFRVYGHWPLLVPAIGASLAIGFFMGFKFLKYRLVREKNKAEKYAKALSSAKEAPPLQATTYVSGLEVDLPKYPSKNDITLMEYNKQVAEYKATLAAEIEDFRNEVSKLSIRGVKPGPLRAKHKALLRAAAEVDLVEIQEINLDQADLFISLREVREEAGYCAREVPGVQAIASCQARRDALRVRLQDYGFRGGVYGSYLSEIRRNLHHAKSRQEKKAKDAERVFSWDL